MELGAYNKNSQGANFLMYSELYKKIFKIGATTPMNLGYIILFEKENSCVTSLTRGTQNSQVHGDAKQKGGYQGRRRGEGEGDIVV